jgi:hypothetical protein
VGQAVVKGSHDVTVPKFVSGGCADVIMNTELIQLRRFCDIGLVLCTEYRARRKEGKKKDGMRKVGIVGIW